MSLAGSALYEQLDKSISILREDLGISYLEALIETGENILDDGQVHIEDGKPGKASAEELEKIYNEIELDNYGGEEIRKGLQLVLIKGMREDFLQPNHQMTPDSLGTFIAYLIESVFHSKESIHLADFSVGTGNLLQTVYYFLKNKDRRIKLTGVDNDELLLSIASTSSALQKLPIQLVHDDALQNLLVEPADIMVSDLPVGYYPVDSQAVKFKTANKEGHSFSHHLLIEQGFNYMKPGGMGFYLVPSDLFDTEEGSHLLTYIQSAGYFQGFIHLPKAMFKTEKSRKSVLIVQKQGENAKQAGEVLLANAPEFNEAEQMREFISELNRWKNNQFNS